MLTWRTRQMYVLDAFSLETLFVTTFHSWGGEGWGLTHDGTNLICSDGTNVLTYLSTPDVLSTPPSNSPAGSGAKASEAVAIKYVHVTDGKGVAVPGQINELQYVPASAGGSRGHIYANIWYKDYVIKIDAASGVQAAVLDLGELWPKHKRNRNADCLNGIAYDQTGK